LFWSKRCKVLDNEGRYGDEMNLLEKGQTWLIHRISIAIKSKWHPQAMITADNFLDKLKVLHHSENFLAVDKMPDLVMNTKPGDERLSLYDQIKHRFPHLYQPARARSWLLCPSSP